MTIITELADGRTEVFESSNYVISKPKDFHPLICKVSVFENGFNTTIFLFGISESKLT